LLVWGVLGLPGAIFLTRIYVRDHRRQPTDPDGSDLAGSDPAGGELAGKVESAGADDGSGVESKESPR
nr:hypothetical protein [Micromonospora sp. DSM 115978]